jgi:hypothetical protein
MSTTMPVEALLFEQTFQMTGQTDFGLDMQSALANPETMLPLGVRLDFPYQGKLSGKISGEIAGIDYVTLRPDGVGALHIHAVITTDDGDRIAVSGTGYGIAAPGSPNFELREALTLYTASRKYAWVNKVQVFVTGATDVSTGQGKLMAYQA